MSADEIIIFKDALLLNELRLTFSVLSLYFALFIIVILRFKNGAEPVNLWIKFFGAIILLFHLIIILIRWSVALRPPFETLYESLVWFGFVSFFVYVISIFLTNRNLYNGLIVIPVVFSSLFYAFFFLNPDPEPLRPALNSGWFFWHAVSAFGSYAVFVNNFGGEVVRLFLKDGAQKADLGTFSYKVALVGFGLLTFAIVSGAQWAEEAWGRYWGWDPKETWALATWFAYGIYIHYTKKTKGLGQWIFFFSLIGFVSMIMTFLGVNWLAKILGIPSLHTYAL